MRDMWKKECQDRQGSNERKSELNQEKDLGNQTRKGVVNTARLPKSK